MASYPNREKALSSRGPAGFSMSGVSTLRWSLEEDLRGYAEAGYEGVGVLRHKVADLGEDLAIDMLAESGLQVTSVSWAGGFTGSDGLGYRESLEDAQEALRLAGALNAGCLIVYPGGRNNHIQSHAERLFRSALESMLYFAESADVTLAIEPMHRGCAQDWTFLTEVESVLALIEAIGSPHLKMVFDTYHFGHDRSLLCNLREFIPQLALVQLADRRAAHTVDADRCRLGTGEVPLQAILAELIEGGYTGPLEVELAGAEFGPRSYESLLIESRRALESLLPAGVDSGLR